MCFKTPPALVNAVKLCPFHPDIDAILNYGAVPYTLPSTHPSVQPLLAPYMPSIHRNIDVLLQSGQQYSSVHPTVSPYTIIVPPTVQCMNYTGYTAASGCPVNVSSLHPSIDESLAAGSPLPVNHPLTDPYLRKYLPKEHRDLDFLISSKTPIPGLFVNC